MINLFRKQKLCRISTSLLAILLSAGGASADSIGVRYPQGTSHGFLLLRAINEKNQKNEKTIALGDLVQVVRGKRIVSRLTFHFNDGSLDDDEAVFTQDRTFRLISDHHIQRGPSFPTALDMRIDMPSGNVTIREQKGGDQPKITTKHMDLPADLANGLTVTLMTNLDAATTETKLPLLVASGGGRLIHIAVTPQGTVPFRVGGSPRPAREFFARAELGGLTGAIAPLVGKQPKDWKFLILQGQAPAFVREEGQFYEDGPMWRIDQIGPVTH